MGDLLNLPIELIESIFTFVNSPMDLISLTETCMLFNNIISKTDCLTEKLTLYIDYPINLELFATVMRTSERKYRNIKITRSREVMSNTFRDPSPRRIFQHVSPYIRHLEFNWSNSSLLRVRENSLFDVVVNRHGRHYVAEDIQVPANPYRMQFHQAREQPRRDSFQEFLDILKEFKNLRSMKWYHVHLERNTTPLGGCLNSLASVRELVMKHCDAHCFEMLSACNQLVKFDFSDPFWMSTSRNPGIESFENFLIRQDSLKNLTLHNIQYSRLFQNDHSQSINFKLTHLELKNIFFKDKSNAEKFFQTQNQLQTISLHIQNEKVRILDEVLFYNDILRNSK